MASEQSSSSASAAMVGGAGFEIDSQAPTLTWGNLFELDRKHEEAAVLADSSDLDTDTMEGTRLVLSADSAVFNRSGRYRVDFTKDRHLQKFLQSHELEGKHDIFFIRRIEGAILLGRDSMASIAPRIEPIEFNTYYTVEGETSLDLWSLHQLIGLPIDGEPYEEVSLPDMMKDKTDGKGRYTLGFSYRYLMKFLNAIITV
ncbi:hypothetical protein Taro_012080, partial [Colocasia esculenta]|nr:hypothetical protein [Colocasia esculenta]